MIGRPRVHLRRTDSTNERARELANAGAPHGTLVTAGEQTAGRGRQGRAWAMPPGGGVLMSLVLGEWSAALPLAAAVATCEALPLPARIKWPNDIWIGGRKVAGILVETRPQDEWAVLGIGVNVGARELTAGATSLGLEGVDVEAEEVLADLLEALERWLRRPTADVLAAWRERDALVGSEVRWAEGRGTATGVDETGALLVTTTTGQIALHAGEVHLVGP